MRLINKIPKYAIVPFFIILIIQLTAYTGTEFITANYTVHTLKIGFIDNHIPFVPFFIIIYVLAYPWWYISPFIVAYTNKKRFYNWALAFMISLFVSGIIFIVYPTTIIRPTVENSNFFNWLTNFIYSSDSPSRPINLFPSFHCLISWFGFIGVRRQMNIHSWYRVGVLIFSLLICLSTLFVKQHYFPDWISAFILAELTFYIVKKHNLGRILDRTKTIN